MRAKIKKLIKNICLEGSAPGLKYFYIYKDWPSRCFWATSLILMNSLALHLTSLLYFRFSDHPTRITIENQFEPLENLPAPSVTICSPNQITMSGLVHLNKTLIDGNTNINLEKLIPLTLGFHVFISQNFNDTELGDLQKLIEANRYTVQELMATLPQSCEDFIKYCIFRMKRVDCSKFFKPIFTHHGLCCSFNNKYELVHNRRNAEKHGFNVSMSSSGVVSSLTVITDYNPKDAMEDSIVNGGATRLMITDWSEFPADDESTLVHPFRAVYIDLHGTETYVSAEVRNLPFATRECFLEEEKNYLPHFRHYHNSDCDHMCIATDVLKVCGCYPYYLPYVMSNTACNLTSIMCLQNLTRRAADGIRCDCPRDCNFRRYLFEISVGAIGDPKYISHNLYHGIEWNKSTTIMSIFFPKDIYVKVKQETVMSLVTVCANIGGVFGLCAGFSVISLLELLFGLYRITKCFFEKSSNNKNKTYP